MIATVITINVLIAIAGFYAAWQIWQLRRTIAAITKTLTAAEQTTHQLLHGAPQSIQKGQLGVYQLRQAYQQPGPQVRRVRQALMLLGLGRSLWWGRPSRPSAPSRRGVGPLLRRFKLL